MTASFIEIADAAVARLKADDVGEGRVHHVVPPESFFSIGGVVVTVEAASPATLAMRGHPVDWNTSLVLECSHRHGVNHERPHEGCTTLAAKAFLSLSWDETLGGLVDGMLPGPVSWSYRDPDKQLAICTMRLTLLHRTNYGAL